MPLAVAAVSMPTPSANRIAGVLLLGLATVLCTACVDYKDRKPTPAASSERTLTIELSTEAWPQFPCTQCHKHRSHEVDRTERVLTKYHSAKKIEHAHFIGWCYRCHSDKDPNLLQLVDGTQLPFERSYELCSSCHGDKGQDWRHGVHGLNVGYWSGPQVRRTCTLCHDPHKPHFAPMTPEAAPQRPRTMPNAHGEEVTYD